MANVTMCPICDQFCQFWSLGDACMMTKAKYFFDNETTVVFALFMSLWSIVFTELWKRYSAEITHRWDVFGYDPEEEHPRPEYLAQLKDVKVNLANMCRHYMLTCAIHCGCSQMMSALFGVSDTP